MPGFRDAAVLAIICLWTANPFLKKRAMARYDSTEFAVINTCLSLLMLSVIYRPGWSLVTRIDFAVVLSSVVAVGSSLLMLWLIRNHDISYIMPIVQPGVAIATVIIGLFKERMTAQRLVGTVVAYLGIYLIQRGEFKAEAKVPEAPASPADALPA